MNTNETDYEDNTEAEYQGEEETQNGEVDFSKLKATDEMLSMNPDELAEKFSLTPKEVEIAVMFQNSANNMRKSLRNSRIDVKEVKKEVAKTKESIQPDQYENSSKADDRFKESKYLKQLQERDAEMQRLKAEIEDRDKREKTRTIQDSLRDAAGKIKGLQSSAIHDIVEHSSKFFISDDGKVLIKAYDDSYGDYTYQDPLDWINSQKQTRSHWFMQDSFGGGARGGKPNQRIENVFAIENTTERIQKQIDLQERSPEEYERQRLSFLKAKK